MFGFFQWLLSLFGSGTEAHPGPGSQMSLNGGEASPGPGSRGDGGEADPKPGSWH